MYRSHSGHGARSLLPRQVRGKGLFVPCSDPGRRLPGWRIEFYRDAVPSR